MFYDQSVAGEDELPGVLQTPSPVSHYALNLTQGQHDTTRIRTKLLLRADPGGIVLVIAGNLSCQQNKESVQMRTYVRVVINTVELQDFVPNNMIGQALKPFAMFVQRQYLQALADIPNVTVLVSARRKVPHCVIGPVETVKEVYRRLDKLKPELFPGMFADEMIAQGTAILNASKEDDWPI